MKILLVDDEVTLAELTGEMLTACGHEVVVVFNGADAMKHVEGPAAYDMLITDANLPFVKGPVIAKAFAAKYKGRPIALISGHLDFDEAGGAELRELNVHFLRKPFSFNALSDWVAAQRIPATSGESESAA